MAIDRPVDTLHSTIAREREGLMGNLVIQFVGICVHVDQTHFPLLQSQHRVIFLANPTRLNIDPRNPDVFVDAHKPKLFLMLPQTIDLDCVSSNGAGDTYDLNRVSLQVANAKPPFATDATLGIVPHLTELGAGEANTGVILDGDDPVGAYFDIDAGTLSASVTSGGAVITTLRVETFGAPILRLKCIDHGAPIDVELPEPDPAVPVTLSIANLAVGGEDNENDYLLDFRVCQNMPADPKPPKPAGLSTGEGELDPRIPDDFSSACSNSNYP
jgi:hypothetical protein